MLLLLLRRYLLLSTTTTDRTSLSSSLVLLLFYWLVLLLLIVEKTNSFYIIHHHHPPTKKHKLRMTSSSSSQQLELLPTLRQVFPTVSSYDTIATIIQANAEGYKLNLHYSSDDDPVVGDNKNNNNGTDNTTTEKQQQQVFLKQVIASKYVVPNKSWTDLRRTLMYLRTEVRFYQEILPLLSSSSSSSVVVVGEGFTAAPRIFKATYQLQGLIEEEEQPTEPSPQMIDDLTNLPCWKTPSSSQLGGFIVMESVRDDDYYQTSPIAINEAKESLSAIAQFHASAWENKTILEVAQQRLSRGSYHLETRNPKELQMIEESWNTFSQQFSFYEPELFSKAQNVGKQIHTMAEYISNVISPNFNDSYATLAHGDYKAMNCFLPYKKEDDTTPSLPVLIVDYASTGVGLGMSDVAMHIHHAVSAKDLANGGEEELVDHYVMELNRRLSIAAATTATARSSSNGSITNNTTTTTTLQYPPDVAYRHYKFAVCDYFRFVLGRFWKSATPTVFEKRKDSPNVLLANRNIPSALAFLERSHRYLQEIEIEYYQQEEKENVQNEEL